MTLCVLLARLGGLRNPLLLLLFYAYFLIHEVRDQARLFQAYGDAPGDPAATARLLGRLSVAVALLLTAVLVGVYLLHGSAVARTRALVDSPRVWLMVLMVLLTAASCGLLSLALWGRGRAGELLRLHRPLWLVYAGILGLLMIGAVLGSVGFNLIILVHVTAWLVFVCRQLAGRPPVERPSWWQWLRTTPRGFVILHLGVALAVLLLMALRVHCWGRAGWFCELFARSSFAYWSILHISIAFWRGR